MRNVHEIFQNQMELAHPLDVLDPDFDLQDEPTFDWVNEEEKEAA